jgi:hypothetical protein
MSQLRVMQLHEAAAALLHGGDREALLQRARKMETASRVIERMGIVAGP